MNIESFGLLTLDGLCLTVSVECFGERKSLLVVKIRKQKVSTILGKKEYLRKQFPWAGYGDLYPVGLSHLLPHDFVQIAYSLQGPGFSHL